MATRLKIHFIYRVISGPAAIARRQERRLGTCAALALLLFATGCQTLGEGDGKPDAPLRNTYWRLATLPDLKVEPVANRREPHFVLRLDGEQLHGSDGCNRISGRYAATESEQRIRFGPIASTRMFCAAGARQTLGFLGALERATRYEIRGDRLWLFHDQAELAGFEAVYLP